MELVEFCGLIIVLFSGVVNSWGDYSYRGGTISYRPNTNYPTPRVEFIYRLAFEADYVYCYSGNIGHRVTWTNSHSSPWSVTKFTYYGLLHGTFNSISSSNQISCNSFNSEEGWSEGNSSFTFRPGYNGRLLIAMTYNYGYWMRNVSRVDGNYGSMLLSATNNVSANGVFNNSSPVSTLPLTVYLNLGIPSVIKIPVEDPDGDIVRCRYASYQECYSGLCTYFPHGVLDEGNCTLSYNGGGYVNQLLPIILKLEDFPSGTTQFDSSNVLGSVDLQFVVHIKNDTAPTTAPATAVAPTTVSVGVANTTVTPALSVRIQGGGSSGLLQVLHNGVWGTVCDDDWSMTNTHVVCRQLGFAGALSYHNSGGGTGQIWLDDVQCSGSESAIQQCRHRGWGIHKCHHIEDIFVTCYRDECSNYTVLNAPDRAQGYRGIKNKCDRYITPAWYRFMGDAGTAIATSCVPVRHCGTAAPGWMTGSHPTQADGVVTRTVCFNWNTTCCSRSNSIRVKNCGEFYVYLLRGHKDCALRYCGNNTESNNTCVSSPCRNGATCTDTDYGYNCTCPYEYTGRHCETVAVAKATNCWHTAVSIHYTVGPSTITVTQSDANSIMTEVLNHGTSQLLCSGLRLKLLKVTIATPANRYVITGSFGVMYGEMNSTQKQTATSCLGNAAIFMAIILRPDYYTSPLKGAYWADRASLTNYKDSTCCRDGLVSFNETCGISPCNSNPCRNRGTCQGGVGWYRCSCPYAYTGQQCQTYMYPCNSGPCRNGSTCHNYHWHNRGYYCSCPRGYTGQQCQTNLHQCNNNPCRNGGTCRGSRDWYYCSCPSGYSGRQCESNLKTNVTCGENYMQIDLEDSYFSDIDWRNLHLNDPSCRATKTPGTRRLRAPLDRCGTTYTENQKTITFWNEVKTDNRYQSVVNGLTITRDRNLLLRFFCSYERSRFVSASFSPSKKTVVASEGSYGNFTFSMDFYQTSSYLKPYSVFAYPVVVYPNQPLWVQYEVKNTNADLVVFAENCRATPSNDPNATPQHVFLQRGCVRDSTMNYWYNPNSKVQRFSIRSFRFVYSNTFLVYLHCELIVCHRNTNNSRCTQGCISSSRVRREAADGSTAYDLSAGPLKGGKINDKSNNQQGLLKSKQLIGGLGGVGGLFFLFTILLLVIVYRNRRRGQNNKQTSIALDVTVNSYEQVNVDSDEKNESEI